MPSLGDPRSLRVAAFEEGGFSPRARGSKTLLLGLVMRSFRIEAVELGWVTVDGLDATEVVLEVLSRLGSVDLIVLGSVTCAGFNLIDIQRLFAESGVPVLVVLSRKPRPFAAESALIRHFNDWRDRVEILRRAGEPSEVWARGFRIPLIAYGVSLEEAASVVESLSVFGKHPEPLRAAKVLARELSAALAKAHPSNFQSC